VRDSLTTGLDILGLLLLVGAVALLVGGVWCAPAGLAVAGVLTLAVSVLVTVLGKRGAR
jgi:membrane protein implicated in regulation of membrane protease activity